METLFALKWRVRFVRKIICMVPLQIARAESEAFVILKDGLREDVRDFGRLSELAEFISFGLYEVILETNENPVVVISSMGKQSTGKSYMLNHLAGKVVSSQSVSFTGTCFDTAGGRCPIPRVVITYCMHIITGLM